jgi:hypothetical protein
MASLSVPSLSTPQQQLIAEVGLKSRGSNYILTFYLHFWLTLKFWQLCVYRSGDTHIHNIEKIKLTTVNKKIFVIEGSKALLRG